MYDEFVSILKNKYNAECFEKGDNTTEMMRNWVKNATEGFISDYAPYCEGARITLLNALCLKGKWAKKCKFDPQQTKNDKFTNYKGEEKSVPFMNKSLYCGYRQLNRVQLVSLPMGQETFNMVFIVPNQGVEIKDCLSEAKEAFIKHKESPQTSYVILSLPKFDVSATIVIDDVLKGLGITEMFKPTADFSKMCDGNLTAFGVQQQNRICIDEEGSTVAASQEINYGVTSAGNIPAVKANRPFIYLITESSSKSILFMGVIDKL